MQATTGEAKRDEKAFRIDRGRRRLREQQAYNSLLFRECLALRSWLARCQEKVGRRATAWARQEEVRGAARLCVARRYSQVGLVSPPAHARTRADLPDSSLHAHTLTPARTTFRPLAVGCIRARAPPHRPARQTRRARASPRPARPSPLQAHRTTALTGPCTAPDSTAMSHHHLSSAAGPSGQHRSTNRYSALQSLIADQDTEIEDELARGASCVLRSLEGGGGP